MERYITLTYQTSNYETQLAKWDSPRRRPPPRIYISSRFINVEYHTANPLLSILFNTSNRRRVLLPLCFFFFALFTFSGSPEFAKFSLYVGFNAAGASFLCAFDRAVFFIMFKLSRFVRIAKIGKKICKKTPLFWMFSEFFWHCNIYTSAN